MPVYLGRDGAIGAAEEITYGTAVARTRWSRLISTTMAKNCEFAPVEDLGDNGTSLVASESFQVSESTGGNLDFNFAFNDYVFSMLLKHAMGAVIDSGSGPYLHTYTMAKDLPVGLTLEVLKGTGHGELFEGCKVNKLTWRCATGEQMKVTAEIIAETSGGPIALATPTIPASPIYAMHHQSGTMTINAVTYVIKSVEFSIDNKLARREQLGSFITLEPMRTGKAEVTCRVTLERVSNAVEALFQAGTKANATITFTNGAASIAHTLHNAQIFSYDCPITRVGVLEETIELRGFRSASLTGLGIILTNALATAV